VNIATAALRPNTRFRQLNRTEIGPAAFHSAVCVRQRIVLPMQSAEFTE
jgi:hypothetical protein